MSERPVVLCVEDNEMNRFLVQRILSRSPIDLLVAETGTEAISVASERHVDLFLVDMMLPDMPGEALIASLRQGPGASSLIYVLSADASEHRQSIARSLGADGYMVKPLRIAELLELVNSLVS